jgi:D-lyxose ketol-isomerase
MAKNITIPYWLFVKVIDLLETWDVSDYSMNTRLDYGDVLFALLKKRQSIELREAYAELLNAENDDARHEARMSFLMKKRDLDVRF